MVHQWKVHLAALDNYIKSLANLPWKKTLTYSACLLTIIMFLWRTGVYRTIPDFASSLLINNTSTGAKELVTDLHIPKPNFNTTIQAIMETPLTPFSVVLGVGTLSISFGAIYALAFLLRKLSK